MFFVFKGDKAAQIPFQKNKTKNSPMFVCLYVCMSNCSVHLRALQYKRGVKKSLKSSQSRLTAVFFRSTCSTDTEAIFSHRQLMTSLNMSSACQNLHGLALSPLPT